MKLKFVREYCQSGGKHKQMVEDGRISSSENMRQLTQGESHESKIIGSWETMRCGRTVAPKLRGVLIP